MSIASFTSLRLTGGISGVGPVTVGGFFTTIGGVGTFTGGLTVGGGAGLALMGSMLGPVTINADSSLTGGGTVAGLVTVGAGGFLLVGPFTGIFNAGGVALGGTTRFTIEGPAQGSQYAVLNVTGAVSLGGGPLTLIARTFP